MKKFLIYGWLTVTAILVGLTRPAAAQVDTVAVDTMPDAFLVLRTMPAEDRIVLRWTHSNSAAWLLGRRVGYGIDRAVYDEGQHISELSYRPLLAEPLMPWPLERYTEPMVQENNLLGVVGQAVHGESFAVSAATTTIPGILQRARETEQRYTFSLWAADLDSASAEALGVRYVDDNVNLDETYVYRVYLSRTDSIITVDTAYAIASAQQQGQRVVPRGVELQEEDGAIVLSWPRDLNSLAFSGFWVERSDNGGQTFTRLNRAPISGALGPEQGRFIFPDTSVVNYKQYQYRVYGITYFGTLSPPVEISGSARDATPPSAPMIIDTEHVEGPTVRLRWELREGDALPADFEGFYIGHSPEHGGPYAFDFTNRFGPSEREGLDSRALNTQLNYYVIASVDTAGNAAPSLPTLVKLQDSIPPDPPANLRVLAVDDTTGRVQIGWERGFEPDLFAYRIYRRHHPSDPFILRNDELRQDTTWADTLNLRSLSNEVFYQIVALDYNYNASEPSEVLEVRLPDVLPPVTPVFKRVLPSDSSVAMDWAASPSFDVARQILYRRQGPNSRWDSLASLTPADTTFIDFDVERLQTYEYTIQAVDSTGLYSNLALPVKGRVYDTGVRRGVTNLTAVADTAEGLITLEWQYPDPHEGEYWFVVYRGIGDAPPARYRSNGSETEFIDRRVRYREEPRYTYSVQVRYRSGAASPLSDPVDVEYPRAEQ